MPNVREKKSLTINELERMLDSHRRKLNELRKHRSKLASKLAEMDQQIVSLNGGRGATVGRAQNAKSLVATMESVLGSSGKPLGVGEIVAKVQAAGYRSNSANFRALVNQTLIKEKRFASAGRGVYQLKK
jgi:septal ring factor EnvC (AmiA/AmiB activator)